ncbi:MULTISPECIES: response regulator [Desulfovibrio]|uniref:Tetratricopeptide repeat-containing protein n=2 Tax=Desulfovibrio desulfuricans TaxID=876 RepID=A0AA94HTD6_DESDE|nr:MULTISPECIES: response regulator [Desulfovibrio]ATD81214.1 histidine kinase [Desulfovibrio sp. G11]SFW54642.1 Tetratricopeptide repeat-containing protein [Desulfovibrio desulfuricans]SPD36842.1 CheY-like superfamily [Desulfovibrio sp. G11]
MTRPAGLNILLLCESESLSSLDRRALREAGASRVECMTSGIEAARMLAGLDASGPGFTPDIVVCSQKLADMDGEQFCAILRLHPLLLGLPILLLLPNDSEAEQLRTLGCGASALLARPYSINVLKTHLDSLAATASGTQQLQAARQYTDTSAFDQALDTYGMLLKPVRQPEDYFRVGMQCLQQRQWNTAINAFQRALGGALIQGQAQLGMAVAWKGKGDMARYRHYLGLAAATFVRAKNWHRARAVYAGLLREDPEAKNPFLSESFQLIRQERYDEAAEVLSHGHELIPRRQMTERLAQTCLSADQPQHMLEKLEDSLGRIMGAAAGTLADDIRANLEGLARQQEEKRRQEAAETQWRATRQAARQRENAEQAEAARAMENSQPAGTVTGRSGSAASDAVSRSNSADAVPRETSSHPLPVPPWGHDQDQVGAARFVQTPSDARQHAQGRNTLEEISEEPVLEPLSEAEGTSGLFNSKPGLNELLSVMKYTWKMARRRKQ